jgi:NADH:ubiquinone oxidoreductase subunit E
MTAVNLFLYRLDFIDKKLYIQTREVHHGAESRKNRITICMGSSCFSRGHSVNAELVQRLIQEGKVRADLLDAEVTGTLCEGLCKEGPIVIIDGVIHRQVTPMVLQDLLVAQHGAKVGSQG